MTGFLRRLFGGTGPAATEPAPPTLVQGLGGPAAWDSVVGDTARSWDRSKARFDSVPIALNHIPKFTLQPGATVFCIGSCFARNVEEHLIYNGVAVSSRRMVAHQDEWAGRPNGIVNKFTTPSMANEIRWAADPSLLTEKMFTPAADGLYHDMQLAPGNKPMMLERQIARRRYLSTDYFPRIFEADVIVMTLGLDECWHDREAGVDLNGPPSLWTVKAQPDRYVVRALDYAETLRALEEMASIVAARNPTARFVVTVSPVPIALTFACTDPVVATIRAKSMLRTVAETFCAGRADADYYPSYEMVTMSPRAEAFRSDCRHVTDDIVGKVVGQFIRLYLGREPVDHGSFSELPYLVANPDVEEALRRGEYGSGYEHWLEHGRNEGRALWPEKPDRRMWKREMREPPAAG